MGFKTWKSTKAAKMFNSTTFWDFGIYLSGFWSNLLGSWTHLPGFTDFYGRHFKMAFACRVLKSGFSGFWPGFSPVAVAWRPGAVLVPAGR